MKRNKCHIFHAWMLLACFVAGQYILYSHTHAGSSGIQKITDHTRPIPKQTVTENCRLCDAMQHNTMAVNSQVYFAPVMVTTYTYKIVKYCFISIPLIHSAGRSPPSTGNCC